MNDDSAERLIDHLQMRDYYLRRRRSLTLVFVGMSIATAVLYCLVFFAGPLRGILGHRERLIALQVEGYKVIPDIEDRLSNLHQQIKLLTTTSIESRLKTIEKALRVGDVQPEQIASIQQMRSDLAELKTYMFRDPKEMVELKQLQTDYHTLSETLDNTPTREEMKSQISFTNNLLFATWAFFGILFTILFGSRFRDRRHPIPTESVPSPKAIDEEEDVNPAEEGKEG